MRISDWSSDVCSSDLHRVADVDQFRRMADAAIAHVGDMEQAVDAAEIDERAIIGDVLDHAVDDLAFGKRLDEARTLLGAGFLEHGAARHDDVAAAAVHLQQLERLRHAHQWGDVADWTDIDLAARQKGHRARKIDGETAFDAAEDHAFDALLRFKLLFKHVPCGFAARAVARQHRRSEEHTSELQSLKRISYVGFSFRQN